MTQCTKENITLRFDLSWNWIGTISFSLYAAEDSHIIVVGDRPSADKSEMWRWY